MNGQDMGMCRKAVVYLTSAAYGKYNSVYLAYTAASPRSYWQKLHMVWDTMSGLLKFGICPNPPHLLVMGQLSLNSPNRICSNCMNLPLIRDITHQFFWGRFRNDFHYFVLLESFSKGFQIVPKVSSSWGGKGEIPLMISDSGITHTRKRMHKNLTKVIHIYMHFYKVLLSLHRSYICIVLNIFISDPCNL